MGNLMVSLRNASEALRVFQRGMGVVQANVSNSSTPGYAKQRQGLEAMRMDLDHGLAGGVSSSGTLDSRSAYLDNAVRRRMESLGSADERTQQLARLEPVYQISGQSGVATAMNAMMQAASAASVAPNDRAARQVVLDRAGGLAQAFNAASTGMANVKEGAEKSLESVVGTVNKLVSRIVEMNREMRGDYTAQLDPGMQAQLHNTLEDLAEMVDYTVLYGDDGSASVYVGGQAMLVDGDKQNVLTADNSGPQSRVVGQDGVDISGQIRNGRLAALLEMNNVLVPSHQAGLNKLAEAVGDQVNATLAGGIDLTKPVPLPGTALFSYTAALGSARTLKVNPITPDELALADPLAPGGNAVALKLEGLFRGKNLDGGTFAQFYGSMAADAGRELGGARENLTTQEQLTAQAEGMRDEVQRVSLDEEAITLLEFQRAYQASAQLIKTINEITDTMMNMLQ